MQLYMNYFKTQIITPVVLCFINVGNDVLIPLVSFAGDMGVGKSCLLHQFTEKKCRFSHIVLCVDKWVTCVCYIYQVNHYYWGVFLKLKT